MELKPYFPLLRKNLIFSGMTDVEIEKGIEFFLGKKAIYSKGEMLNRVTEPLAYFGIVLSGVVHVCTTDWEGQKCIMAAVGEGEGFGEALSFLGKDSDVYIRAAEDCQVLWLSTDNVRNAASQSGDNNLYIQRFIADLAERALSMNNRIQIMSQKTLREKIFALLSMLSTRENSSRFSVPFDRNGMAVYLGTDRSSLSRELSKMQMDGIIRFSKNIFEIL